MERALAVLDSDGSGTIELEEFMKFREFAWNERVLRQMPYTPAQGGRARSRSKSRSGSKSGKIMLMSIPEDEEIGEEDDGGFL